MGVSDLLIKKVKLSEIMDDNTTVKMIFTLPHQNFVFIHLFTKENHPLKSSSKHRFIHRT